MDHIALANVRAYGRHGANVGERDVMQPFDIDVWLRADLSLARESDDLADTIDYAAMHARIVAIVRDRSYVLLERLADEIVRAILEDARISLAGVTIAKPRLIAGATPSVTVTQGRAPYDSPPPAVGMKSSA